MATALSETLIAKIATLRVERIAEVEDFVDFIRHRDEDRAVTHAAALASAPTFAAFWSNPADDAYDAL